mgnify:CR=1 FL=1
MASEQTIDRRPGNRVTNDLLVNRLDGVDLQEVSLARWIEEGLEQRLLLGHGQVFMAPAAATGTCQSRGTLAPKAGAQTAHSVGR